MAAKEITVPGLTLFPGITVFIKFLQANTAVSPTLAVNNGAAHAIYQYGTTGNLSNPETSGWQAGAIVPLTYDGHYWIKVTGYNTNNTYTNELLGQGYGTCLTE